jgi:TolB-like protein/DNA-binding SARP family transcriptional activator
VYTLRLLGTASIETAHGPVSGRAAQGRRLALLALLALARGRPLTRDKLIALLWPEASPERARPQLSDALYVVRNGLGEDVVRAMGDGLALNRDAITSDVARFEGLLEEGRPEEAVALYGGPLLDGFHVPDSTEFESWLEGERAQLDRQYAQALETLAEGADTPDAALGWWRRRAAHDPYNGRVALNLMRALDAVGDRAGALQHARIHTTLLREEFGTEPAAEVTAFVEQLRLEPSPAPKIERLATSRQSTTSPTIAPGSQPTTSAPIASGSQPTTSPPTAPESQLTTSPPTAPGSDATTSLTDATRGPQDSSASEPGVRRQRRHRVLAAAAALVVILAVATVYGVRRANAHPEARSVGVLPFLNMSPDPANTYFSDGLSEQIILALSRIDGLQVAARTSSFALRDRELGVRAIGDTLGVQAVLEGSVLMDGERLRVIAQLIDARTGYHIWSDQYDGDLGDAFGMQDRIAAAIADALHLRLAGGSAASTAPAPAPSFEAYDLYLRGLYLRNSLSADALQQADQYFDRVIRMEPRFAQAWAAKASVVAPQAYFRYVDRDTVVAELRTLTARALELDPSIGEAHASLGILKLFFDWDWSGAEAALRRAIELNPNDAHAWHHLANYHAAVGQIAEAAAARERAVQLDPLNARSRIVLASDHVLAGDSERALAEARRAEQLDPTNPMLLGRGPSLPAGTPGVLRTQGRLDEAVEEYLRVASMRGATAAEIDAMRDAYAADGITAFWREWLAMDVRQSGASPDPVRMAATHMLAGDSDQALDWLERALDERNPGLIYIRRDVAFAPLHAHPRFQRIAAALNFPD